LDIGYWILFRIEGKNVTRRIIFRLVRNIRVKALMRFNAKQYPITNIQYPMCDHAVKKSNNPIKLKRDET